MNRLRDLRTYVALIIALGLGSLIAVLQFDRESRSNASFVQLVPEGIGGFADEQRARLEMLEKPEEVTDSVQALIRHRPIDVGHLSILASWAMETGDRELAVSAMTEAATRGWRDHIVQISVLASAFSSGQYEAAATRLDALARTQAPQQYVFRAIDIFATAPEARALLATRLAESASLREKMVRYSGEGAAVGSLLVDMDRQMQAQGSDFTCEERKRLLTNLMSRAEPESVELFRPDCVERSPNDFSAEFPIAKDEPFAWQYPQKGGVAVRPGTAEGAMLLRNRDNLRQLAAFKRTMLPAGRHRIEFESSRSGATSTQFKAMPDFSAELKCSSNRGTVFGRIDALGVMEVDVPEDCATQVLNVTMGRGEIDNLRVTLLS